jgi:Tol biopolymer transport system component
MLTGISPFNRPQTIDILHAILHENPKPVSEVRPQAGRDLDRVIQKALAKDRNERYQTLVEMKTDLLRLREKKQYKLRDISTGATQNRRTDEGALNKTASAAAAVTRKLTSSIKRFISSLRLWPAAIALGGLILVAAIWWYFSVSRDLPDAGFISSLNYVQLLNWRDRGGSLQDSHGVLSRDGKMIAYRSRIGGKGSIWIKQTSGGDPVQVVKDDWNNSSPIFSPDNDKIAFVSKRDDKLGIWSIPTLGGSPSLIAYIEDPENRVYELRHWSKGGATIYYQTNNDLFSVDVATGEKSQITKFDTSNLVVRDFSVSPGEDRIAYVDLKEGGQNLWVAALAGGPPSQVTKDVEEDVRPVWHPDGKRIIYSSKRDGVFQVCLAYLDNRAPIQITFGENDSFVSDVSADGRKVLYSGSREESDIWAVETGTGEESQITSDLSAELWPDISPDGKAIVFQSVKQLSQSSNIAQALIISASLDGEGRKIQLSSGGMAPKWSPDGRTIGFLRTSGTSANVWTISAAGGREQQLSERSLSGLAYSTLPYNRFNTSEFSWSPDSSRISYCSEIPDIGIWVFSAVGRDEVRIVTSDNEFEQLSSTLWSPEGGRIAYLSNIAGRQVKWVVKVTDVKTRETKAVYQTDSVLRLLGWSTDGGQLFLATLEGIPMPSITPSEVKVFQVAVQGGSSRLITTFKSAYLYNTCLSPDRRFVGTVSRAEGRDDIYLVPTNVGQPKKVTANIDPRLYFSAITWSPDAKKIYFAKQSRNSLIYLIDNFR